MDCKTVSGKTKHSYLQSRRAYRKDPKFPIGAVFAVSGDSKAMWLTDYNVRVSTVATIVEQPETSAKKVLVTLDEIDGDGNVCAYIRKSVLKRRMF